MAGLAGLALLLFGHSTEARPGACQSYEAAFNFEAGLRDGTLKQAKASILEDGYSDGSPACFEAIKNEINQCPMPFHWLIKLSTKERAAREHA